MGYFYLMRSISTAGQFRVSATVVPSMRLDEQGLLLGAETRLVRFAEGTNRLATERDGDRLLALLSIAFRRQMSVELLRHVDAASAHWQRGYKALANLRLVFAKLPQLSQQDAHRLRAAEYLLDEGVSPLSLMTELGFASTALEKYDPEQPRVPAGHGLESGRWADDSVGAVSELPDRSTVGGRRDEPNSAALEPPNGTTAQRVPQIVQIAADGPLRPGGINVVPLAAPDPLDPKGLNQPLSLTEQQRIAATVNTIIGGNPADLSTLNPHAYKNKPNDITGAVLPAPVGKYVTYYARYKGEPEGNARIVMDQSGQVYYTNNHYRSFYPVDIMGKRK